MCNPFCNLEQLIRRCHCPKVVSRSIIMWIMHNCWNLLCISADIFDEVDGQIKKLTGLEANCVGGGRIEHHPDEKIIKVYGYSQVSPRINQDT